MADVLDLLAISVRFFEGFDDQRSSTRNNFDCSLSVLNGESNGYLKSFPVLSVFGDVFTNFFWGLNQEDQVLGLKQKSYQLLLR